MDCILVLGCHAAKEFDFLKAAVGSNLKDFEGLHCYNQTGPFFSSASLLTTVQCRFLPLKTPFTSINMDIHIYMYVYIYIVYIILDVFFFKLYIFVILYLSYIVSFHHSICIYNNFGLDRFVVRMYTLNHSITCSAHLTPFHACSGLVSVVLLPQCSVNADRQFLYHDVVPSIRTWLRKKG